MFGFDKMFDFNGDGRLDSWERAAQFQFCDETVHRTVSLHPKGMDEMLNEDRNSSYDDDADVFGTAGLDYDELEMMDPAERRVVLECAGLNPDEYAF